MKRLGVFAGLLLLGACAGPKADVPREAAVIAPAAWRGGTAAAAEVTAGWWRGFNDPALGRIVETALANNDDIAIAVARVAEARAQFRFAQAQTLPNVGAGAGIARDRDINPGFGIPEEQTAGEGEVEISYDLDLFRTPGGHTRSGARGPAGARGGARQCPAGVAAAAAGGYITLRALDARLLILRDTLAARGEELRVAKRRADAAYGTQLELAQAEAAYHATEQLIPPPSLPSRDRKTA